MSLDKTERTVIFGGLGLILVLMLLFGNSSTPPQPQKAEAEKKAEDERSNKIAGAVITAQALQRSMRDPGSFTLSSVLMEMNGAVCYEYRARNGFGGMNVGRAVLSAKGAFKTEEMEGFYALWKKECAHKVGDEEVRTVSYMLDHLP